jgi:hypothetical protein
MSAPMIEKSLIVTGIGMVYELTTGEPMYQVNFGEYLDSTPELTSRLSAASGTPFNGKKIAANWLLLNIKTTGVVPYKVGSKWKLTVEDNGSTSLVEIK